ncbi:MAG: hypothetical protein GC160_18125 [Acidobacteria bacterium]|nr:hypothetical protein [Acidobacteriota bacterium]
MRVAAGLGLLLFSIPLAAQEVSAVNYRALTGEERWDYYIERTFRRPEVYLRSGALALADQSGDNPPEWQQGVDGFGRRMASRFGTGSVRVATEAAAAAALGQDPRYVSCGCDGTWNRVKHALTATLLTYNSHGERTFASARVGAAYASGMATLTWYPDRYGWKDGMRQGTQIVIAGGLANLLREFAPDLKRKVFGKRH